MFKFTLLSWPGRLLKEGKFDEEKKKSLVLVFEAQTARDKTCGLYKRVLLIRLLFILSFGPVTGVHR